MPGHLSGRLRIASSDLISASTVSPYPDLASTVVVPCVCHLLQRHQNLVRQQAFVLASRTLSRLDRIPPPASAICS